MELTNDPVSTLATTIAPPRIAEALDETTGLIPRTAAYVGITVECELSPITRPLQWLGIEIQDAQVMPSDWRQLIPPVQIIAIPPGGQRFNIFAPAPADGFRNGTYHLRTVLYSNIAGSPDRPGVPLELSAPGPFEVDLIAPYSTANFREEPLAAEFPPDLPYGAVIDYDYLAAHGGVLFTIPDNTFLPPSGGYKKGDVLTLYFSPNRFPQSQFEVGVVPMLKTGNTFFLKSTKIVFSGYFYFFYTITDMAGNVSLVSYPDGRMVEQS